MLRRRECKLVLERKNIARSKFTAASTVTLWRRMGKLLVELVVAEAKTEKKLARMLALDNMKKAMDD